MPHSRRRTACLASAVLLLSACGDSAGPAPLILVELSTNTIVSLGGTAEATATVIRADEDALVWRSSDESVASVDSEGLVTAHANGSARIEAVVGATVGGATIVVRQEVAELSFVAQPGDAEGGAALTTQPTVEARDAGGTLLEGTGPVVSLSIGNQAGAGLLYGVTELALQDGIASFSDLVIDKVGVGYTLRAAVEEGPSVESAPFDVVLGPPSPVWSVITVDRQEALVDDTVEVRVILFDAGANPFLAGGEQVTLTVVPEGAFGDPDMTDNGDGSYTGRIVATTAASPVTIHASFEGQAGSIEATVSVRSLLALDAGGRVGGSPDVSFGTTCALLDTGALYCWGDAALGAVGHGSFEPAPRPVPVVGPEAWDAVSVGQLVTCGVTTVGGSYCWGSGDTGDLGNGESGNGSADNHAVPTAVADQHPFRAIHASPFGGACGITGDDRAFCWGLNPWGRLGNGDTDLRDVPTAVAGDLSFGVVALGTGHGCGITTEGAAYCWGREGAPLGIGPVAPDDDCGGTPCALTPVAVTGGITFVPTTLALSGSATCAIEAGTGIVYCWGHGPLGDGLSTTGTADTPTAIASARSFVQLDGADGYFCGLDTTGALYCWGSNTYGQLGDGTRADAAAPVPVDAPADFVAISTASSYACAVTVRGSGYCWGRNDAAELGDGTTAERLSPTRIRFFED